MRLVEKFLIVAVITGIVLKFSLITQGEIITMYSLHILATIYFIFGFFLFNQIRLRDIAKKGTFEKLTAMNSVLAVMTGITLSTVCIGALFKLMIFPGAGEMLMIGSAGLILVSVLVIVLKSINRRTILIRTIPTLIFGISLLFTSELSMVKFQYRNHSAYIEAYMRYHENPKNEMLRKELQLEYYRMTMTEEGFKKYEASQNN